MMNYLSRLRRWWRDLFRRRRFNMLNATDNSEEWHIHLSPASIFAGLTAFALMLFILILTLMAYTPVLEFLPGYRTETDRLRESLVQNIIRLDSMEQMMNDMMTYNENIALIMEGRTPVVRSFIGSDSTRTDRTTVLPSREDSLLRAQMEGDGPYSLAGSGNTSRGEVRKAMELVTPVDGLIAERFDIGQNRFGVRIAAAPGARITAIDNGSVVQSLWTPDHGYVIAVQHTGNLISIYKNLSQSLVSTGQTVHGGDQLGYNTESAASESDEEAKLFEFELWSSGKPVDPEGYIVF